MTLSEYAAHSNSKHHTSALDGVLF